MSLERWDQQSGSLPPKMFGKLWTWLFMMMKEADDPNSMFRRAYEERWRDRLHEWLKTWGHRVPCGTCSVAFIDQLWPTFPSLYQIQTQPRALFTWAVTIRGKVSEKTGGRIYTREECDRKDTGQVFLDTWDALILIVFGYPAVPHAELVTEMKIFFQDLVLLWPGWNAAQIALWREFVHDPVRMNSRVNLLTTVLHLRQKLGNDYRLLRAEDAVNWVVPQIQYWNSQISHHNHEHKSESKLEHKPPATALKHEIGLPAPTPSSVTVPLTAAIAVPSAPAVAVPLAPTTSVLSAADILTGSLQSSIGPTPSPIRPAPLVQVSPNVRPKPKVPHTKRLHPSLRHQPNKLKPSIRVAGKK